MSISLFYFWSAIPSINDGSAADAPAQKLEAAKEASSDTEIDRNPRMLRVLLCLVQALPGQIGKSQWPF